MKGPNKPAAPTAGIAPQLAIEHHWPGVGVPGRWVMTFRAATFDDCSLLAELNHQLIQDEGHRNRMTVPELEQRMRSWLSDEYRAVLFEDNAEPVAYALYRKQTDEIYLRQLFVVRHRRNQGIGRCVVETLRSKIWPTTKRLTVEVLVANQRGVRFWRAVGYNDYALSLEILPSH